MRKLQGTCFCFCFCFLCVLNLRLEANAGHLSELWSFLLQCKNFLLLLQILLLKNRDKKLNMYLLKITAVLSVTRLHGFLQTGNLLCPREMCKFRLLQGQGVCQEGLFKSWNIQIVLISGKEWQSEWRSGGGLVFRCASDVKKGA